MDGASPAHRDFQVYDTLGYKLLGPVGIVAFGLDMNDHANVEAREPTEAEMNQMVDDLRMQFLNAFGREAYERAVPEEDRKQTEERKRRKEQ